MRGLITGPESGSALFVNLNGGRLTRQGFWKIVKGYARSRHYKGKLHWPPAFLCLTSLENGASVKDIQTMMYMRIFLSTQVAPQLLDSHVKQVYKDCHPKANWVSNRNKKWSWSFLAF